MKVRSRGGGSEESVIFVLQSHQEKRRRELDLASLHRWFAIDAKLHRNKVRTCLPSIVFPSNLSTVASTLCRLPTSKETLDTLERGTAELLRLLGDVVDGARGLLGSSSAGGGGAGEVAALAGDGADCC